MAGVTNLWAVLELFRSEGTAAALGGDLDAVLSEFRRCGDRGPTELLSNVIDGVAQGLVRDLSFARYRLGLFARVLRRRIQSEGQLQVVVVALEERGRVDGQQTNRVRQVDGLQQRLGDRQDRDLVVDAEGQRL